MDNGITTFLKAMANTLSKMVTYTRDNFKTVKEVAPAPFSSKMGANIMALFKMTNSMASAFI